MSNHLPNNHSATPNTICDTCTGFVGIIHDFLLNTAKSSSRQYPAFGPNKVRDIQASGLKGCHICSIISQSLCPAHSECEIRTPSESFVTMRLSQLSPTGSILGIITAKMEDPGGRVLVPSRSFYIEAEHKPNAQQTERASWSISTDSDATFDMARSWLNRCLSQHPLCEEMRNTPASGSISPSPTYLVEVNSQGIRLCRTQELSDFPHYLTLSHRWGGSHIFRLTSKNLTNLLSKINIDDLPKTFRDSVLITRQLGYHYIWIDSLCIIQDSKEHWESESIIMGDIYRASVCTIAALGGVDGDSGCFKTRNPLCFQRYTFNFNDQGRAVYMPPEREKKNIDLTGYGPNVEPLHERAWVVQERMLSPRTLFYGTFGIYWECAVGRVDSSVSTEISKVTPTAKYAIHQACNLEVSSQFDASYKAFSRWWTRIIEKYNPCGLTYGSDKLVAIAGIVKLVESRTGLHNVAGLWREHILPELLWYVERPQRRSAAYQAPTWSWASLNCEIVFGIQDFDYTFHWKVDLLDVAAKLAAVNGQLAGARIRVRGPLMRVRWEPVEENHGYKLRWGTKVPETNSADDAVAFMPDVELDPEMEIWALLVVHATSRTAWMNMGLVLAKKSRGGDAWIRIGSFRQYDWPEKTTEFFGENQADNEVLTIE